jgi:hypothetical protein
MRSFNFSLIVKKYRNFVTGGNDTSAVHTEQGKHEFETRVETYNISDKKK